MTAAQTSATRYPIPDAHQGSRSFIRLRMSWAALAALTLVVAGMSFPARYQQLRRVSPIGEPAALRRGVQPVIDRRFYRRKYDSAKALADFSATVRDEVDLSNLAYRLLDVVEETMQPAHVSLWLRETADGGLRAPGGRQRPALRDRARG